MYEMSEITNGDHIEAAAEEVPMNPMEPAAQPMNQTEEPMTFWEKIKDFFTTDKTNIGDQLEESWGKLTGWMTEPAEPIKKIQSQIGIGTDEEIAKPDPNGFKSVAPGLAESEDYQEKKAQEELEEQRKYNEGIMQHLEEREDTRYQRLMKDLEAAGINPNLFMGQPGQGVGYPQSDPKNVERVTNSSKIIMDKLLKELELVEKGDQNAKDRLSRIIATLAGAYIFKKG